MKLLTDELRELLWKLPRLYAQDGKGMNAIAYIKFFDPLSNWTWYVTEGEPSKDIFGEDDFEFFGLVIGHETEFGYFTFSELQSLEERIERDLYFTPAPLNKLMVEYNLSESKAA